MWVVYSSHLFVGNVKNSIYSLISWPLGYLFWSTTFFQKFILQNHMHNYMIPDAFVINLISQTIHVIRLKEYVHIPLRCWGFWDDTILGPHTVQCRSLENIPQVRATRVLHLAAQDSTWVHWLVSSSLPLIFKLKAQLPSGMCPLYHENYYLYCKHYLHSFPCLCFLRR